MNDRKVTILMCAYNSSEYIRAAVESVFLQTYQNFELIIIDDGSTDNTWQMISEFAEYVPQIKVIRNPVNQGASVALNEGLQVATGDYITRLDSDDVMLPDRLTEQVSFLERSPEIGACGTNVIYIDPVGEELGISAFPLMNDEIQETLPDAMCFCGPTVLIRRDCFEQAGYFFVDELASSEDYDICLRLSEVTQLANLERPLYLYRQHAGSVSTSKRQRQLINKAKALEQAVHRRYGPNHPQKFTDIIARDYLRAAVLGCNDGDLDRSREALAMALRYSPGLLDSASLEPTLEEVIRRSMLKEDLNFSLAYLECLFQDLFPKNSRLRQIEHHLVSELYIAEAFAQAQNSPSKTYNIHLVWKGIRYDPGWLANKGVLSLLVKQFIRLG